MEIEKAVFICKTPVKLEVMTLKYKVAGFVFDQSLIFYNFAQSGWVGKIGNIKSDKEMKKEID